LAEGVGRDMWDIGFAIGVVQDFEFVMNLCMAVGKGC
jgi:hypothetical protein